MRSENAGLALCSCSAIDELNRKLPLIMPLQERPAPVAAPTIMTDAAVREQSPKRPLDALEDGPTAKRPRRPYKHHHTFRPLDQPVESREPAFVDQQTSEKLLFDAIKTIVEEEGLKRDIQDPVIESLALTAFHDAVQECTAAPRSDGFQTDISQISSSSAHKCDGQ